MSSLHSTTYHNTRTKVSNDELSWEITRDIFDLKKKYPSNMHYVIPILSFLLLLLGLYLNLSYEFRKPILGISIFDQMLQFIAILFGLTGFLISPGFSTPSRQMGEHLPARYTINPKGITILPENRTAISYPWNTVRTWTTAAKQTIRRDEAGQLVKMSKIIGRPEIETRWGNILYVYIKTGLPWSKKVIIRTTNENKVAVANTIQKYLELARKNTPHSLTV